MRAQICFRNAVLLGCVFVRRPSNQHTHTHTHTHPPDIHSKCDGSLLQIDAMHLCSTRLRCKARRSFHRGRGRPWSKKPGFVLWRCLEHPKRKSTLNYGRILCSLLTRRSGIRSAASSPANSTKKKLAFFGHDHQVPARGPSWATMKGVWGLWAGSGFEH